MDIDSLEEDKKVTPQSVDNQNIFQKILGMIFKNTDPEWERKKLLKDIKKLLKRQRFKFYKVKGEEALADMASFFYELYKTLGPAQIFLGNADSSGVLKSIIIESFLSDKQRAQQNSFEEEVIREKVKKTDIKALSTELKEQLIAFFSGFDIQKVKDINATYNLLLTFLQLVRFDYYFLLKKFDSSLPENDFIYKPRFEAINGEYVVDDLKDFLEVLGPSTKEQPWDMLFDIIKEYKGDDVLSRQAWKKVLRNLGDVEKSRVLELIIKHIESDPYYKVKISTNQEKIVEDYLNKIKTQTELTIQKIVREQKTGKIEQLLKSIFGTSSIHRMKFYTEKANMAFSKKMLGGFLYYNQTNYLKAFLLDFYKKDIKEVVDILLIRGEWATNLLSQQLSESFHRLMVIAAELVQFDESCSEEGELGAGLFGLIKRADRDKTAMKMLKQTLKKVNDTALNLISESAKHLIVVGKNIKQVLEDHSKEPHELIINWRELEQVSGNELKHNMIEIYKKVYTFIQLLNLIQK